MKIGVVLLNYNSYADTINLVRELQKQSVADCLQIVIVDNASPNGSYEKLLLLHDEYSNVIVLQTKCNEGYARGNNYGLEYLYKHGDVDFVAVMNNDIVLPNVCLENLVNMYATLSDACLIAPLQLMPGNRIYCGGFIPRFRDDLKNLFFLYRYIHKFRATNVEEDRKRLPEILKVDIVPGSFLFASMERFKEIGFFYPGTFLFVEERFIAYAAHQHGYNNYILTDQTYLHAHSKTINTAFSQLSKYCFQYKGWLLFTRKCRRWGNLKALFMWIFIQYSLFEVWSIYAIKRFFVKIKF